MAKRSLEQLSQSRQRGMLAGEILRLVIPVLDEREQQIVTSAIGEFRSTTLDSTRAIAYVAALSELRAFREEMEHRVRQGERAAVEQIPPSN